MTEYKHKYKLPVFEPDDYEAFKKVLGSEFSKKYGTYSDWLGLRGQWQKKYHDEGCMVVDVKISLIEFSTYLETANRTGDLNDLLTFADSIKDGDRDWPAPQGRGIAGDMPEGMLRAACAHWARWLERADIRQLRRAHFCIATLDSALEAVLPMTRRTKELTR